MDTRQTMITTFQQHVLLEHLDLPEASGSLSWLLSGITLAAKMIEAKIRNAGLSGIIGRDGGTNVHGEAQQRLDVFANEVLLHCLGVRDTVAVLISEENEESVTFDRVSESGRYIVVFDPLDGSSNIDVNINVGTIFSIYRYENNQRAEANQSILQPGICQLAAGYVLYGPSTMLVYTAGRGVYGFTLDSSIGAFVLSHDKITMPQKGKYYSCNEANIGEFPENYQKYIEHLKVRAVDRGSRYSSRYVGSLVADFHRTLLEGGIFLYPPTVDHVDGKLRLLYEANPLAFIAEQAGGMAIDGERCILRIHPKSIHQRIPLVIGGSFEVESFLEQTGRLNDHL
jgi:fructose-1,6-bisphosphatase I